MLEELPKLAQRTADALPRNPKDVRAYHVGMFACRVSALLYVCVWVMGLEGRLVCLHRHVPTNGRIYPYPYTNPPQNTQTSSSKRSDQLISLSHPKNTNQLVETVRELGSALPSEARNVFLRTPEGLETPHFRVLYEGEGVRMRAWVFVSLSVLLVKGAGCVCVFSCLWSC